MEPFRAWFIQTFPNLYTEGMTYKEMLVAARDEIEHDIYYLTHVSDTDFKGMENGFKLLMTMSYSSGEPSDAQKARLDEVCSNGYMFYLMVPVLPATFQNNSYRDLFLNMI